MHDPSRSALGKPRLSDRERWSEESGGTSEAWYFPLGLISVVRPNIDWIQAGYSATAAQAEENQKLPAVWLAMTLSGTTLQHAMSCREPDTTKCTLRQRPTATGRASPAACCKPAERGVQDVELRRIFEVWC